MAYGIRVLDVTERPSISRAGKPVSEVVLAVETEMGANGQITLPQNVYAGMEDNDLVTLLEGGLAEIRTRTCIPGSERLSRVVPG